MNHSFQEYDGYANGINEIEQRCIVGKRMNVYGEVGIVMEINNMNICMKMDNILNIIFMKK